MRLSPTPALALGFVLADGLAGGGAAAAHVHLHGALARPFDTVGAITAAAHADTGEDAYAQGKRLLGLGDTMGALAALRQAVARAPGSVDALNGVAVCYDRLGRPDIARGYYEAGLAIDPASAALLNNLGYSRYLAGDHAGAIAPLTAAARADDPAIAAAAHRTLALIAAAPAAPVAAVDVSEPAPLGRVEITSEGEQRLVMGDTARLPAGANAEAAALASVAPAWTPERDRVLLAEVRADDLAQARARAAERERVELAVAEAAAPEAARIAPLFTIPMVAAAWPVGAVRGPGLADRLAAIDVFTPARPGSAGQSAVGGGVDGAPALPQRERVARSVHAGSVAGQRPLEAGVGATFDSDDARLNAFAARVRAGAPPSAALTDLAVRVRAA